MAMTADNLGKVLSDKLDHGLPKDLVKQLPSALAEPIMVFESASEANSFVVLTELKHEGRSVMVAVHLDTEKQHIKVNNIASAYKRISEKWYIWQIEEARLLYQDKKKSLEWARTNRLQLPRVRKLPTRLSRKIILTEEDIVKPIAPDTKPQASIHDMESVNNFGRVHPPLRLPLASNPPLLPFPGTGIPYKDQTGNLQGQRGQSTKNIQHGGGERKPKASLRDIESVKGEINRESYKGIEIRTEKESVTPKSRPQKTLASLREEISEKAYPGAKSYFGITPVELKNDPDLALALKKLEEAANLHFGKGGMVFGRTGNDRYTANR